jgi:AraC family transcriptional regulator
VEQAVIKWILATVLGTILGIAGYFFWYLGAWKPVIIAEKKLGPINLIYKNHVGAYHKIAPVINEVETWAKTQNLTCEKTFGEYFDDPRVVEEGRLRSRGGCLIDKPPKTLPPDYQTLKIPEKEYVTATFEGSPAIGPMKVYPKVAEYFEAKNSKIEGSVMEIYEVHSQTSMTTTYLFGK